MQQCYGVTEIQLLAIVETLKVFKSMLWGQRTKGLHRPQKLIQDILRLTSDHVYWGRSLFKEHGPKIKEHGPKILHIKDIHNTAANAFSRLDFCLFKDDKANWITFTKCWCIIPWMLLMQGAPI